MTEHVKKEAHEVPPGTPEVSTPLPQPVNVPSMAPPTVKIPDPLQGAKEPVKPTLTAEDFILPEQAPMVMYACADHTNVEAQVTAQPLPNILNLKVKGMEGTYFPHDAELLNVPPNESDKLPSPGTWFNKDASFEKPEPKPPFGDKPGPGKHAERR